MTVEQSLFGILFMLVLISVTLGSINFRLRTLIGLLTEIQKTAEKTENRRQRPPTPQVMLLHNVKLHGRPDRN